LCLAKSENLIPVEAMLDILNQGKLSGKADWNQMVNEVTKKVTA
jgi:hypothetical protein